MRGIGWRGLPGVGRRGWAYGILLIGSGARRSKCDETVRSGGFSTDAMWVTALRAIQGFGGLMDVEVQYG